MPNQGTFSGFWSKHILAAARVFVGDWFIRTGQDGITQNQNIVAPAERISENSSWAQQHFTVFTWRLAC